ncbi:MAG TPA: sulfurtransferase-like selenium metabolism protein YedF [Candidatus Anaerostipes avicola]|uniref:sulfurtransferase-like selenium metabolism protein YedF n=1 Tax=Anaerostipes sp. TaxID=1872530 RepID=UPI001F9DFE40|nr:sulfurtransferase-like selenium metabolism protein YedF [Anaerostipes sp.]HJC83793.1 sulfurtransferase-like selenium metabolism protein YedF [Candidatus Anaerostipes avicola]
MIKVNAIGDACPIPVVKTKNAIKELNGPGTVEVLVDNEIAVQNLTKMAVQKGYEIQSQKLEEQKYQVIMTVGEGGEGMEKQEDTAEETVCIPDSRNHKIVVISSGRMGEGNDELGEVLMKGFIYALTQQDELPETILFYNGGAPFTCEGSPALEDLKQLEAQGVEILTCGTCLNYYGLSEKLKIGDVTNMYVIAEKMMQADSIIKP